MGNGLAEMAENIEGIQAVLNPARAEVNRFIRENPRFLWCDSLNHPDVLKGTERALELGKWIEFLTIITWVQVQTILKMIEKNTNVSSLLDVLMHTIREEHGVAFAQTVGGFLWSQSKNPDLLVHQTSSSLMRAAANWEFPADVANRILTEIAGRERVL